MPWVDAADLVFRGVILPGGLLIALYCLGRELKRFFADLRADFADPAWSVLSADRSGGEWMGPVQHAQAARLPHPPTDGGGSA